MMTSDAVELDPLLMSTEDFKSLLFCLSSKYDWHQLQLPSQRSDREATASRTPETVAKTGSYQSSSKCSRSSSSGSVAVIGSSRLRTARRILSDSESEEECKPIAVAPDTTMQNSPKLSSSIDSEVELVTASKRSARARIILSDDSDSEPENPVKATAAHHASSTAKQVRIRARVIESSDSEVDEGARLSDDDNDSEDSVAGSTLVSENSDDESSGGGEENEDYGEYQYDDWLVEDSDDAGSWNGSEGGGGSDGGGPDWAEDKENATAGGPTNRGRGAQPREVRVPAKKRPPPATAPAPPPSTPKVGRKEANFQRVLALSTGKKRTKSYHHSLAQDLYRIYNEVIFDGQLPEDLAVTWNKRLLTTAGFCKCWKKTNSDTLEVQRIAAIELSTKVVDSEERMRETLVHEMCHAATYLIDCVDNAHHGPLFKRWGRRATRRFPDIGVVDRCHSYEIHAAHKFQCVKSSCGVTYSRHTKKGLNTDRQRCGVCCGRLEYVGMTKKDGTAVKARQATGFSAFVKEHFARVKAAMAACGEAQSTKDVMRELAARYKEQKGSTARGEEEEQRDSDLQALYTSVGARSDSPVREILGVVDLTL